MIGAGIAGLAIAGALVDRFDRVTVIDRDGLPHDIGSRKGVPQDRHVHLLLPAGVDALEELFPGLPGEMVAAGAACGDVDRIRVALNGHRLARGRTGHTAVFASRPFIEAHVRRRVRDHPAIAIREASTVRGLVATPDRRRITGVRISASGTEQTLPADLVVDCAGRGSRTPAWIAALGYAPPAVEELRVDVRYATLTFVLPSEALDGDRHVLVGPTPEGPHGGAMTHVGTDRWMVTLFAMGGKQVPMDPDAFQRFARRLPITDIHDAIRNGQAIAAPAGYRFAANTRHRYETLPAFPDGLLVAGDAVCSFNPIYGQGMTVAALEAVTLRRLVRRRTLPAPHGWFDAIAPTVEAAWELATGADLAISCIDGRRTLLTRAVNRYLRRVHAAARNDPVLAAGFMRVAGLLDPPRALLHPATVARVLRRTLRVGS